MSDSIKHECGIALIRLLKPLDYYQKKYGTSLYGLNKLYLLMEKQHNRGQDGVGITTIKLDPAPGQPYINRRRSISNQPISDVFERVFKQFKQVEEKRPKKLANTKWLKNNVKYMGELMLGHLRYGTHGKNSIDSCHPFIRSNNWMTRNLVLAGNFNMTNVKELIDQLIALGQHPKQVADTVTCLEKIGHFLDVENQRIFDEYKNKHSNQEISNIIGEQLDMERILSRSVRDFDGGYTMAGLIGHGDAFVIRDPAGIRPAYYYHDDEVAVVASERPAIQTTFNLTADQISEVDPGHAFLIKKNGTVSHVQIQEPTKKMSCSFERIYFSRGTDSGIYQERKQLGKQLTKPVLKALDGDLKNTVFSFIPNTAEVAFYGLVDGVQEYLNDRKLSDIKTLGSNINDEKLKDILNFRPRIEKLAVKDVKLRTFITEDSSRDELVSHVYDVTYGLIKPGKDTIVALDDSIVRGTTLEKSILSIFDRLGPKKVIIVSSAPQIRYPDCYGIDMSRMNDFIAFRAALALLEDRGDKDEVLQEVYQRCLDSENKPASEVENYVKAIYDPFTADEISAKISEIVRPKHIDAEVQVIYQSITGLKNACPDHEGDWYFTGNFPTPGGNKVVNRAFINFMKGNNKRAY